MQFKSATVESTFAAAGLDQDIFDRVGSSTLVATIYNAAAGLDSADSQLSGVAAQVGQTARKVRQYVVQGISLNALGELQRQGAELDRLCAVRAERITALSALLVAYKAGSN